MANTPVSEQTKAEQDALAAEAADAKREQKAQEALDQVEGDTRQGADSAALGTGIGIAVGPLGSLRNVFQRSDGKKTIEDEEVYQNEKARLLKTWRDNEIQAAQSSTNKSGATSSPYSKAARLNYIYGSVDGGDSESLDDKARAKARKNLGIRIRHARENQVNPLGARFDPYVENLQNRINNHFNERWALQMELAGIPESERNKLMKLSEQRRIEELQKRGGTHLQNYNTLKAKVENAEMQRFIKNSPNKYNAYKGFFQQRYPAHVPHTPVQQPIKPHVAATGPRGRVGGLRQSVARFSTRFTNGTNKIAATSQRRLSRLRPKVGGLFQNPFSAKNIAKKFIGKGFLQFGIVPMLVLLLVFLSTFGSVFFAASDDGDVVTGGFDNGGTNTVSPPANGVISSCPIAVPKNMVDMVNSLRSNFNIKLTRTVDGQLYSAPELMIPATNIFKSICLLYQSQGYYKNLTSDGQTEIEFDLDASIQQIRNHGNSCGGQVNADAYYNGGHKKPVSFGKFRTSNDYFACYLFAPSFAIVTHELGHYIEYQHPNLVNSFLTIYKNTPRTIDTNYCKNLHNSWECEADVFAWYATNPYNSSEFSANQNYYNFAADVFGHIGFTNIGNFHFIE